MNSNESRDLIPVSRPGDNDNETTEGLSPADLKRELRESNNILLFKSWRSQWYTLLFFVVFFIAVHMVAYSYPSTLIPFELAELNGIQIGVVIPVLMIFPLFILLFTFHSVYDTRYVIRQDALLIISGLVSYRRHTIEIFYSIVQSIEVDQSVVGRLLNFGDIHIGIPGHENRSCTIEGIRAPHQCKSILQRRLQRVQPQTL